LSIRTPPTLLKYYVSPCNLWTLGSTRRLNIFNIIKCINEFALVARCSRLGDLSMGCSTWRKIDKMIVERCPQFENFLMECNRWKNIARITLTN
jgi:hypothetical protein